ncbi:MAG: GFA family protein [Pseudomonadota bacterium]
MHLASEKPPLQVVFCHCGDCKRWTGAPAPAFAAFKDDASLWSPDMGAGVETNAGIRRWNCPSCASPIAATFHYIPGQIYVPLGVIDQGADLPAEFHCHGEHEWSSLCIKDGTPRHTGTASDTLNEAGQ